MLISISGSEKVLGRRPSSFQIHFHWNWTSLWLTPWREGVFLPPSLAVLKSGLMGHAFLFPFLRGGLMPSRENEVFKTHTIPFQEGGGKMKPPRLLLNSPPPQNFNSRPAVKNIPEFLVCQRIERGKGWEIALLRGCYKISLTVLTKQFRKRRGRRPRFKYSKLPSFLSFLLHIMPSFQSPNTNCDRRIFDPIN